MEQIHATATKALKYTDKDRPWPGKLAVFLLKDRAEFVDFMRHTVKKSPGEDDASFGEVRGDDAILIVGMPKGERVDPEEQAKSEFTTMLLKRKMGAGEPPAWVHIGFAHASAHRAIAKSRVTVRPPASAPLSYLWADGANAQAKHNYATYVIDYMAYGPLSDSFATFVEALRPGENGMSPSMKTVLESIKLDEATLEIAARRWIKPPAVKPKPAR